MGDEEEILILFDSFWFQRELFPRKPHETNAASSVSETLEEKPELSFSPTLQTILSCKEVEDFSSPLPKTVEENPVKKTVKRRKINRLGGGRSKSLPELEFEELKGFMDLGFVFSEEDKIDLSLVSMIPGLQRFDSSGMSYKQSEENVKEEEEEKVNDVNSEGIVVVSKRPYLSEAWKDMEQSREENKALMKWRIPATGSTDLDMKHNLKFWAHTVASTVR